MEAGPSYLGRLLNHGVTILPLTLSITLKCHNHNPQPTPDTKMKRKRQNINAWKINIREHLKSTLHGPIFSKRLTNPFMFGNILNSNLCSMLGKKFEMEGMWHAQDILI